MLWNCSCCESSTQRKNLRVDVEIDTNYLLMFVEVTGLYKRHKDSAEEPAVVGRLRVRNETRKVSLRQEVDHGRRLSARHRSWNDVARGGNSPANRSAAGWIAGTVVSRD